LSEIISVTFERGLAFRGTARGFGVGMDMAGHRRSSGVGPTPSDLLVMAIGGCLGMHVAIFCEKAGVSPEGIRVDLAYTLAEEEGRRRVASVYAEVQAPGVPAELRAAAEKAARESILPNTLARPPVLDIVVETATGAREVA